MEKSLYQAPVGLAEMMDAPEVEIEVEDPESMHIGVGDVEIDLKPQRETAEDFDANLAEFMDDSELQALGNDLVDDFVKDGMDRKDWIKTYIDGLKLLGLNYEERTEPWQGACGVFHPMLTEAVVRFQSEAMMETFPAMGPVKTQIVGETDLLKEESAARVREDMNYQLTEVMTEYRRSMRSCCGHCRWQALRSRRSTTTRAKNVRWRCLSPPRTSWCRMGPVAWRLPSGLRM